jgi:hypothetical protein
VEDRAWACEAKLFFFRSRLANARVVRPERGGKLGRCREEMTQEGFTRLIRRAAARFLFFVPPVVVRCLRAFTDGGGDRRMADAVVLKTKKVFNNKLLQRRQMIVEVHHGAKSAVSRKEIKVSSKGRGEQWRRSRTDAKRCM